MVGLLLAGLVASPAAGGGAAERQLSHIRGERPSHGADPQPMASSWQRRSSSSSRRSPASIQMTSASASFHPASYDPVLPGAPTIEQRRQHRVLPPSIAASPFPCRRHPIRRPSARSSADTDPGAWAHCRRRCRFNHRPMPTHRTPGPKISHLSVVSRSASAGQQKPRSVLQVDPQRCQPRPSHGGRAPPS